MAARMQPGRYRSQGGGDGSNARSSLPTMINRATACRGAVAFFGASLHPPGRPPCLPALADCCRDSAFEIIAPSTQQLAGLASQKLSAKLSAALFLAGMSKRLPETVVKRTSCRADRLVLTSATARVLTCSHVFVAVQLRV